METIQKHSGSFIFLIHVTIVAALGGLLFGYDTGVINGSIRYLQLHFDLSGTMKGLAASSALIACVFGAAFAGSLWHRINTTFLFVWLTSRPLTK